MGGVSGADFSLLRGAPETPALISVGDFQGVDISQLEDGRRVVVRTLDKDYVLTVSTPSQNLVEVSCDEDPLFRSPQIARVLGSLFVTEKGENPVLRGEGGQILREHHLLLSVPSLGEDSPIAIPVTRSFEILSTD